MQTDGWCARLNLVNVPLDDTGFILAQDVQKSDGDHIVKRYMYVPRHKYEHLSTIPNAYEVCRDEAIRVYFDIDLRIAPAGSTEEGRNVLHEALSLIKIFLFNSYSIRIKKKNAKILSACTNSKISFHVILPDVAFADGYSRSAFGKRLRGLSETIDPAPYGRNCLFRMPLCSKLGKLNSLVPVNLELTTIPNPNLSDYHLHSQTEVVPHIIKIEQPKQPPQERLSGEGPTAEYVISKLRDAGDLTSRFYSMRNDNQSYYFQTQGTRRCLSGSNHIHTSNNFYITFENRPEGARLVYRCFSMKCSGMSSYICGPCAPRAGSCSPHATNLTKYEDRYCRPFHLDGKLQVIKSEMSTGKTSLNRAALLRCITLSRVT